MSEQVGPAAAPGLREATARPERSITRRSGLPTGRAVVGALLVTLAILGLFVAIRQANEGPTTDYVVMARRVQAGERITADDLTLRTLELEDDVASFATSDMAGAIDAVALETLLPGQLLQPQAIIAAEPGEEATDQVFEMSFLIERSRALAGTIKPGDRVDVVATVSVGQQACTSVVVSDARVVSASSGASDQPISTGGTSLTVTLAMEQSPEVLGTVFAVDEADVTIVRTSRAGDSVLSGSFCADAIATTSATDSDTAEGEG